MSLITELDAADGIERAVKELREMRYTIWASCVVLCVVLTMGIGVPLWTICARLAN